MKLSFIKFVSIFTILGAVDAARILGIYPGASISHQVVFRPLTLELVKRGHEVVLITPNPVYKKEESPKNLVEIDISDEYKKILPLLTSTAVTQSSRRGVIMHTDLMTDKTMMIDIHFNFFSNSEVDRLIKDKNQTFDLVIFEALTYAPLIFSELFDAPAVMFSSLYGWPTNYNTIGAVARHPILYPYFLRQKLRNLSILEKIEELYLEYKLWNFEIETKDRIDAFLKSRFGADIPSVKEMEKRVVLLLANSHPIFDGNRPVPPATVYLGAVHLPPRKPLPEDLQLYLDSSTRGVVYVSLGSNVRPSLMDKEFLDVFLEAFEQIPYDILWRFDGDNLHRKPENVKFQKWFPQRDLLFHPNIKLFVTQGGMQSTDEAIDAEVPVVGIPIMGDQFYNTNKYMELGIGEALDSYTMVADNLVKAVNTVANDPRYKENMRKLKAIMRDQPETPIARAVWWTEHVLRHKGSRHLIGPAANLTWHEYLMLDVLIALAIGLILLVLVTFVVIKCIVTQFKIGSPTKIKNQ